MTTQCHTYVLFGFKTTNNDAHKATFEGWISPSVTEIPGKTHTVFGVGCQTLSDGWDYMDNAMSVDELTTATPAMFVQMTELRDSLRERGIEVSQVKWWFAARNV